MKTLFLVWRQPERRWWPVGRLTAAGGHYVFAYTKGAAEAAQAGFRPLASFPDRETVYVSPELFPLFSNRVYAEGRPEYADFITWAGLREDDDPIVVLGRSLGPRVTDLFEVFARPEPDPHGRCHSVFFVDGLAHRPAEAQARALRLSSGTRLSLEPDWDNGDDPFALKVVAEGVHVGYVPRYFCKDVKALQVGCQDALLATVRQVNPEAPRQFQLLCSVDACWPAGFQPCSGPEYEPMCADADRILQELTTTAPAGAGRR